MAKILHIQASPRPDSYSRRVAEAFLARCVAVHPEDTVETFALFNQDVPAFEAPEAKAKYVVLAGGEPTDDDARAWKRIIQTIEHFKSADKIVLSTPMWNFGIPYRLKQYLDVIVQPGLTFSYTPDEGYKGLVTGRPVLLILARGGAYPPESPGAAMDFQRPYLEATLGFIGFTDIKAVVIEPTLQEGPEVADEKVKAAIEEALALAETF